jgi:hypothetical protein
MNEHFGMRQHIWRVDHYVVNRKFHVLNKLNLLACGIEEGIINVSSFFSNNQIFLCLCIGFCSDNACLLILIYLVNRASDMPPGTWATSKVRRVCLVHRFISWVAETAICHSTLQKNAVLEKWGGDSRSLAAWHMYKWQSMKLMWS